MHSLKTSAASLLEKRDPCPLCSLLSFHGLKDVIIDPKELLNEFS